MWPFACLSFVFAMTKQMSAQNLIPQKALDSKHLKPVRFIQANNTKYFLSKGILFQNQSKMDNSSTLRFYFTPIFLISFEMDYKLSVWLSGTLSLHISYWLTFNIRFKNPSRESQEFWWSIPKTIYDLISVPYFNIHAWIDALTTHSDN